jgi:MFS family permease
MPTSPAAFDRRRGLAVIIALAIAGSSSSFVQTILVPIQARLPELLDAPRSETAWAITVTMLAGAVATPIGGRLGDLYGKRRVAAVMLSALVVGSVVCALSVDVVPMIVGRALQGFGVSVIPLGVGILRDVLPKERLIPAIAILSSTVGVGAAVALPLSAVIADRLDWHVNSWLAAALGAASVVLVLVAVPRGLPEVDGAFDVIGAAGLAVGVVALLLALTQGNQWGWTSPATLALLIGAVAVLAGWCAFELRTPAPLVDIRLTAQPSLLLTNLATIALGFAFFASSVVYPQLLVIPRAQGGFGIPLIESSLFLMSLGVAILVVSPVAGMLARRVGPKPVLVTGALFLVASYLTATLITLEPWHIVLLNALVGAGIGCGLSALPALVVRSVPPERTSGATGLNTLMQSLGSTTASAVTAAIIAASVADIGGVPVPTRGGFTQALTAGLIAASVCLVLALLIPRPRVAVAPVTIAPAVEPSHS